jgi:anaphase-promoting complex subunit 6
VPTRKTSGRSKDTFVRLRGAIPSILVSAVMDAPPAPPRRTLLKLREVVHDCLDKHLSDSAVFFADKLVSMTAETEAGDIFLYCQALFAGKHFRRALTVMRRNELLSGGSDTVHAGHGVGGHDNAAPAGGTLRFKLLAARCFAATREWDECLAVLGDGEADEETETSEMRSLRLQQLETTHGIEPGTIETRDAESTTKSISLTSALRLLRGEAHAALENKPAARVWFTKALTADPFCYQAFEQLIVNHMLSADEERELLLGLNFSEEDEWLRFLYTTMGKKYDEPDVQSSLEMLEEIGKVGFGSGFSSKNNGGGDDLGGNSPGFEPASPEMRSLVSTLPPELIALADNGEVLLSRAEWYYHRGDFSKAHDLCLAILDKDPFQLKALPVYLAVTVELRKKNELFICAHKLVEEYPEKPIAWFAVGCYYYCVRKFDAARRFFSKATALDPGFVQAW